MKRILVLGLISLLLLTGCRNSVPPTPVREFDGSFSAKIGEAVVEGEISCPGGAAVFLRVTTPDEIKGLCYEFKDELSMSFDGIEVRAETDYLPHTNFALGFYRVILDLPTGCSFKSYKNGDAVFEGNTESGEYTLLTDPKGNIKNISIEDIKLRIDFHKK